MNERRRILLSSIGLIFAASISTALITIYVRYDAAFAATRARLNEEAQSHASLIAAVARFESRLSRKNVPPRSATAPLGEMVDVNETFRDFGATGEFALARREGDQIVWLLEQRQAGYPKTRRTPLHSDLAEPMRRALGGESGTLIGPDYRGERVLAAFAPIPELGWGIVAKIDVAEIHAPFVREGLMAAGIVFLFVSLGVVSTLRATSPLLRRLEAQSDSLREARDRLEVRVAERTSQLSRINRNLHAEIQERKRTESALRAERDFAEGLIETAQVIVLLLDTAGRIGRFNRYMEELSGYRIEEVRGKDWFSTFLPERERQRIRDVFSNSVQGVRTRGTVNAILTKNGGEREIEWYDTNLEDDEGKLLGILAVGHDITERRRLEHQLRAAASQSALAEEHERRKLAIDVHDGIGQLLALANMKLGMLRGSAEEHGLGNRVRAIEALIGEAHHRAGSLTFQLSPPILHDVGLGAAVQWLADDLRQRFGLHVAIDDRLENQWLDEGTRVTLFRSLNELLVNVIKHAQVDKARVRLWRETPLIKISVDDDGVGFAPEVEPNGFGLFSIGERLRHLGGSLEVEAGLGAGTKIILSAPIGSPGPRAGEGSA